MSQQLFCRGVAVGWILLQQREHDILERRRHVGTECRGGKGLVAENRGCEGELVLPGEGPAAREHLEEDDAQCP